MGVYICMSVFLYYDTLRYGEVTCNHGLLVHYMCLAFRFNTEHVSFASINNQTRRRLAVFFSFFVLFSDETRYLNER